MLPPNFPLRKKLNGWVEMEFTQGTVYRGIVWLKTDFGGRGDRIDWVADLPWGAVHVGKLLTGRYKEGWIYGQFESLTLAMDHALERALASSERDIQNTIEQLRKQIGQQHLVAHALGVLPEDEAQ